jgi:phosphatidylinositol glycan class B
MGESPKTAEKSGRPEAVPARRPLHPEVLAAQVKDVLQLLLIFRFVNALCVKTLFQPDEYFQALEPALNVAFGPDSGAWLTWVFLLLPYARVPSREYWHVDTR